MKKTRPAAAMGVVIAGAVMASAAAQAQSKPIQSWQPAQHEEPDPAKRVPEASQQASTSQQAQSTMQPQPYTAQRSMPARYGQGRGGAFLGVQGGKGRVYEGVDQSALAINAGYRWQAGAVALVGIEVAHGRLDSTEEDGWRYGKVEYDSIGVNARFNFGRASPVYGLVRAGYWAADDSESDMDVDGGYFGLGLGVDVNRMFNLSLVYTNYVYFNDWEGDGLQYDDVNRADTLMLGAEVRF
jgi:hypothetical protein